MFKFPAVPPRVNTERADQAEQVLEVLEGVYKNGDPFDNLTDLLADLLHSGVSVDALEASLAAAEDHYSAERAEEGGSL
jgi:hypothetical protein